MTETTREPIPPATGPLTRLEMEILEFERTTWRHEGHRLSAILERFGHTPTRYTQIVLALIDRPEALAYDPLNVKRLRRLRDDRAAERRRTAR